jgi:hypothetical protein
MAQLAAERQPEPDTRPPIELARAAVAMARRVGDADTLRATLSSASMAMILHGDPDERATINRETLRLAMAAGDKRLALRAHLFLAGNCVELGDFAGVDAHLRSYASLTPQLGHNRFRWVTTALAAAHAARDGRFAEAERCNAEAERQMLAEDETRGSSMVATPLFLACTRERYVELAAIEARVRDVFGAMREDLGGCIGEMLIAYLYGRAGERRRAETQLASLRAHPLFDRIREPSWLALLADPCALAGDAALAQRLYDAILPRAHRFFHLGPLCTSWEPPYARQLGVLAMTLGRVDDAVAHFTEVEARVTEVRGRAWLARARYELAAALLRRGAEGDRARATALLSEARALAVELGQEALLPLIDTLSADAPPSPPPPSLAPTGGAFTLAREGDFWTLVVGARTLRLRDSRGVRVLSQLVANPGQEFHVLQLVAPGDEPRDEGDAGEILDETAVQRYKARLLELRESLEEAERFADRGRADRVREEMEFLTDELARAVGLGGRARRTAGAAERARTAVQKRLRGVIQRIEEELPELGRHLDQTIRTGAFCGYLPDGRTRRS